MRTFGKQEWRNHIIGHVRAGSADIQKDDSGQIIIHTNLYMWDDESVHDEPQPKSEVKTEKDNEE